MRVCSCRTEDVHVEAPCDESLEGGAEALEEATTARVVSPCFELIARGCAGALE